MTSGGDVNDDATGAEADIEDLVRQRLRGLRVSRGFSLDELAARTDLSASTLSRIETGKRSISLDVLRPLCSALGVDLASLLDVGLDDDVVIRPVGASAPGHTIWPLSRQGSGSGVAVVRMRLEPDAPEPVLQVHPGHDWFYVLSGTVVLHLGDRQVVVAAGEAAEFSTMTPHAFRARDAAAEVFMLFDRDGEHAHVHVPTVGG
jgi:DNA-binding Xre family transcriptional regulator/quercetin dioxygenase-like cupin family protein